MVCLFLHYRVKKILGDFSGKILEIKTVNKSRTNQLATQAAAAILEQVKKNETDQLKKKSQN